MTYLFVFALSTAALASPTPKTAAPSPDAGSLWDYIEAPSAPIDADAHDVAASHTPTLELRASRMQESAYVNRAIALSQPPIDFYKDPVGYLAADPLHLKDIDPSEFDIPVVVNDAVVRWMEYFTGRGRAWYGKWLARSGRYWPMMHAKLEAAGAPRDLVFLSMIESGYATHAYSRAAAVGLWQFIASTGRGYDMRIDWWVDERRDPEMATDSAIRYLQHLEKKYGHWYLAWAAYNAGPTRVNRGIRTHNTRDFWTLVRKDALRAETENYVPKLLAAAIIGKHPERYGFGDIVRQEPMEHDTVTVPANVGIDVLAKCSGVTVDEFRTLNPHLRRWALPPSPARQIVHVPLNGAKKFLAALDKVPTDQRITHRRHTVKTGETLGKIASQYGVNVNAIQSVNKIRNPNRISVGTDLVIPVDGSVEPHSLASSAGGKATPSTRARTHTVRNGETLSGIASKHGVRTRDIQRWNSLASANRIQVGQKLTLYSGGSSKPQFERYTVRRGDSLIRIAQRHGCTVSDIQKWNNLKSSRIMAGQTLKIQRK